jgi:hypothetical protein
MTDYCTMNATEADFNAMALGCGICVEVDDGEGNVSVVPSSYLISLDRIGPITMPDGTVYSEYYTNIRFMCEVTEEQATALAACSVDPSQPQYREWA